MSTRDWEKEQERREGMGRMYRFIGAQDREIKMFPGMTFWYAQEYPDGLTGAPRHVHSLKILEDSHGFMTVRVRHTPTGVVLFTVRFPEVHHKGVVWSFRDACRLNMIGIDPKVFSSLLVTE